MPANARFAIARIGAMAAAALATRYPTTPQCTVTHVFETSFSVALPLGRFICIGTAAIGDGPLNAVCTLAPQMNWLSLGLREGQAVAIGRERLRVADGPTFDLSGAAIWQPPPWPTLPEPEALLRALQILRAVAQAQAPDEGFARIVLRRGRMASGASVRDRGLAGATARRAIPHTAILSEWLRALLRHDTKQPARNELDGAARRAAHALIGLGPGLTPSGDDLLSGLLIAVHASGETTAAGRLAHFVRSAPDDATSRLSRAFLEAAAEGCPSAALHQVVAAILDCDAPALRSAVDRLARVGHTSGWDMLSGVMLGLEAVASAKLNVPG